MAITMVVNPTRPINISELRMILLALIAYSNLSEMNLAPSEIMDNMAFIMKFGVAKSQCCSNSYSLMFRPTQMAIRMSVASSWGLTPSEAVTSLYRIPNNVLLARVVAERSGRVSRGALFIKSPDIYKQKVGVSDADLVKLVPVGRLQLVAFEQEMREKHPEYHSAFKSLGQNLV